MKTISQLYHNENPYPSRNENQVAELEQAIKLTGFGKYHYLLLLVGGWVFGAAGFQCGLNAYILPSAKCDFHMTSTDMGLLNAVFLGGGILSSFLFGVLADQIGRKTVLVYSLFIDGILTLLSSVSQTYVVFVLFRFFNGFMYSAAGTVVFPYLGEFFCDKRRGMALCSIGFFWSLSWIILPAAAWLIIPLQLSINTEGFVFNSWRLYVAIMSIPALASATVLALCFPESPKFILSQGRIQETLNILKKMYSVNNDRDPEDYPVKTLLLDKMDSEVNCSTDQKSVLRGVYVIWEQTLQLFSKNCIFNTFLACGLQFTCMFGFYGLGFWLPELFNRFEEHYKVSNISVSVCELTRLHQNITIDDTVVDNCSDQTVDPTVFINTLIIGASCLLGNIGSAAFASKIGLRNLTFVTMFVSGISAASIYFLHTTVENLIVSCIFLSFVGAALVSLTSAITELFPTKVRSVAVCLSVFFGRIGAVLCNLTLGYVLDISCEIPVVLITVLLLVGSGLGLLLPKKS